MLISVIIPLYNKEASIKKTIQSVTRQSFSDYEIVVVDDGSTDNSLAVVRGLNYPQIKIICQDNSGPSKARNTGIENSSGEWLIFLDADDEILPNAFDALIKKSSEWSEVNCFAFNFYTSKDNKEKLFYKKGGTHIVKNPFKAWCKNDLIPRAGATFIRKKIVDKCRFNENYRRYEDAEWIFKIMKGEVFVKSSIPIMKYNIDNAEASIKRKDIKEDYLGHLIFSDKDIWEQVAIYQLYVQACILYPEETTGLYNHIDISFFRLLRIKVLFFYCKIYRCLKTRL